MRVVNTDLLGSTVEWSDGGVSHIPLIGPGLDGVTPADQDALRQAAGDSATEWFPLARRWGVVYVENRGGATLWRDGKSEVTGDHLISTIKMLRSVLPDGARVLVLAGDVRVAAEHDYDSVGALAAAVIRLRVDQWVGVGLAVKALSTQVGLEGSWDGESLWWELPGDAYDYLRAWPKPEDVIVVSGDSSSEIRAIMDLVEADNA